MLALCVLQHQPDCGSKPGAPKPEESYAEWQLAVRGSFHHMRISHGPHGSNGPVCELPQRLHSCLLWPSHHAQKAPSGRKRPHWNLPSVLGEQHHHEHHCFKSGVILRGSG